MPPQVLLSNEQVADVLTFVRNSWGNAGEAIAAEEVRAFREERN
jgi:nitrite reductase (NO-forming)